MVSFVAACYYLNMSLCSLDCVIANYNTASYTGGEFGEWKYQQISNNPNFELVIYRQQDPEMKALSQFFQGEKTHVMKGEDDVSEDSGR